MDLYALRADGALHTSDIRGISVTEDGRVLTASRDCIAKVSPLPDTGDEVQEGLSFVGHTAFVNWALYHPALQLAGGVACVVTGGNDGHVGVWNVQTTALEAVLDGHTKGVCVGAVLRHVPESVDGVEYEGDVVTGDWGGVCHVFDHRTGRIKRSYTQHTNAIRGVAQLPCTSLCVTGSGDKTAHVWDVTTGATVQICVGHEDVVQCLCAMDVDAFATGSNDCTIRIWQLEPHCAGGQERVQQARHVLRGHDSLVYAVAWNATGGELVSGSEDHTVVVWGQDADAEWRRRQCILHPCLVWTVAVCETNGDLVTGGADGVVRVWTRQREHVAGAAKLEQLRAQLAGQQVDAKVAPGPESALDVTAMPTVTEMHRERRGRVEGEKCFARNEAGEVEVYGWSSRESRWDKIGVVVSGPGHEPYTGGTRRERQRCGGVEYDYVFDVEVQGTMLQLPYNRGDSVLDTAQRFIDDHPGVVFQDSKETIQNFLLAHIDPADVELVTRAATQPSHTITTTCDGWWEPWYMVKFNADGAQRRLSAVRCVSDDVVLRDVMKRVETVRNVTEADAVMDALTRLLHLLPQSEVWVGLDAVRYLLVAPALASADKTSLLRRAIALVQLYLADPARPGHDAGSEAGLLAEVWLAGNVVGVLSSQTAYPAHDERAVMDQVVVWAVTVAQRVRSAQKDSVKSNAIRQGCAGVLRNLSLLAVTHPVMRADEDARSRLHAMVLPTIAQCLLAEASGSTLVPSLLTTLLTLYREDATQASRKARTERRTQLIEEGKRLLYFTLQAIATGAVAQCHDAANQLLRILSS